jgi:hypothetical protein
MLTFCKYLNLAIQLMPAGRSKGLAIQVAGRLDGSGQHYILGSGQKDSVTRREALYHLATGQPYQTAHPVITAPTAESDSHQQSAGTSTRAVPVKSEQMMSHKTSTQLDPIQANLIEVLGKCDLLLKKIRTNNKRASTTLSNCAVVEDDEEVTQNSSKYKMEEVAALSPSLKKPCIEYTDNGAAHAANFDKLEEELNISPPIYGDNITSPMDDLHDVDWSSMFEC